MDGRWKSPRRGNPDAVVPAGLFGDGPWLTDLQIGDLLVETVACWTLVLIASGVHLWYPGRAGQRGGRVPPPDLEAGSGPLARHPRHLRPVQRVADEETIYLDQFTGERLGGYGVDQYGPGWRRRGESTPTWAPARRRESDRHDAGVPRGAGVGGAAPAVFSRRRNRAGGPGARTGRSSPRSVGPPDWPPSASPFSSACGGDVRDGRPSSSGR